MYTTSQVQFHEGGIQFSVAAGLQNIPKQHCGICACSNAGLVVTDSYLIVKSESIAALS